MGTGRGAPSSRWGSRGSSPLGRAFKMFFDRRTFLQAVSSEKVRSTNLNCSVIVDVRHDGSEPCVDVLFGGLGWGGGRKGLQAARAPSVPAPQPSPCLTLFFLPQETGIA